MNENNANEEKQKKAEVKSMFQLYEEKDIEKMKSDGKFELVFYDEPVNSDYLMKKQKILTQQKLNQNRSYSTKPAIKFPFKSSSFDQKLFDLMKESFEAKSHGLYNPNDAKYCCRLVCDKVRTLAKSLKFERYKYVVNTIVLQKLDQSVLIASTAYSEYNQLEPNNSSDGYVCQKYETKEFVAICLLYAIYHE